MAWQRLAHVELTSNADSLDTGTFTAKKCLWVQIKRYRSGVVNSRIQFNGDTGGNYAARYNGDGGTDTTVVNQTSIFSHAHTSNDSFTNYFITNNADNEKLIIIEEVSQNSAGAGNAPKRSETVAKWTNTSAQITSIQCINTDTGDLASGTTITVYGTDSDSVGGDPVPSCNLQTNTIWEESDTGKHYIWTGSAWTEVA